MIAKRVIHKRRAIIKILIIISFHRFYDECF
jgi:hypothetical protein